MLQDSERAVVSLTTRCFGLTVILCISREDVVRNGHFTLKQLRLSVLNEKHTNSYIDPGLLSKNSYNVSFRRLYVFALLSPQIFRANYDPNKIVEQRLTRVLLTRLIRIMPVQWHTQPSIRMDFLGSYVGKFL